MVKGVTMTADAVRLRPPMHRVSPRALWYWAARAAMLWIVLLVPQVIWWFADSDGRDLPHLIVDSERGPIEQLFKLANVTVTTASAAGPIKIDGLAVADADQLVADLTTRVGRSTGDAT
jgi:membrane protein YdbS with pleckstrin-like domain